MKGERGDSNPRIAAPQAAALTTWRRPPAEAGEILTGQWQGALTGARLGLDGCRGGWVLARLANQQLTLSLLPTLSQLTMTDEDLGCIDMPIGLPSHGQPRCCDRLVRRLLAPARRSSSVFPAPGRCCLPLSSHGQATTAQRSGGGPGLSIQSWNLLGRIRELDHWLQVQPQRPQQMLECHPELTFLQLQQRHHPQQPAPVPKHQPCGQQQRLDLLRQHWGWDPTPLLEDALARSRRHQVQSHDLVDALACLVVASDEHRQPLPNPPVTDGSGLPMAITCLAGPLPQQQLDSVVRRGGGT